MASLTQDNDLGAIVPDWPKAQSVLTNIHMTNTAESITALKYNPRVVAPLIPTIRRKQR